MMETEVGRGEPEAKAVVSSAARNLGLKVLVTLDALLRHRNISRAAVELNVSRPAVSATLARLRHVFGDPLLVQVGREWVLTSAAESIKSEIREILLRLDRMVGSREPFDPDIATRRFRCSGSERSLHVLLPELMRQFAASAPCSSLEVSVFHELHLEGFRRGEIDLLIVPEYLADPEHPTIPIYTSDYVCVAWVGNEAVGSEISSQQFFALRHLIREPRSHAVASPMALNDQVDIAGVLPDYDLLSRALVGTSHIAIFPRVVALAFAAQLPLKLARCTELPPGFAEVMQWHELRGNDSGIAWLRTLITTSRSVVMADRSGNPFAA